MKTLATLIISSLMIFAVACGDNVGPEDGERRDDEVLIIPHAGEALTALESAEDIGFKDAVYLADADIISAFGDMALADDARDMPGIADVVPAEAVHPINPDLGIDYQSPAQRDITGLTVDGVYNEASRVPEPRDLSGLVYEGGIALDR